MRMFSLVATLIYKCIHVCGSKLHVYLCVYLPQTMHVHVHVHLHVVEQNHLTASLTICKPCRVSAILLNTEVAYKMAAPWSIQTHG